MIEGADGDGVSRLLIGKRAFCSMLLGWWVYVTYLLYEVLSDARLSSDSLALGAMIAAISFAVCLPVILLFSMIALVAAESIARWTTRWSVVAGLAGAGIFFAITQDTRGALPILALVSPLTAAAVFWLWMKRIPSHA